MRRIGQPIDDAVLQVAAFSSRAAIDSVNPGSTGQGKAVLAVSESDSSSCRVKQEVPAGAACGIKVRVHRPCGPLSVFECRELETFLLNGRLLKLKLLHWSPVAKAHRNRFNAEAARQGRGRWRVG